MLIFLEDCPEHFFSIENHEKAIFQKNRAEIYFFSIERKKRLILQKVENLLSSLKFFVLLVFLLVFLLLSCEEKME
jgi:hypothetical protein